MERNMPKSFIVFVNLIVLLFVTGCSTSGLPPASMQASKTTNPSDYTYLIGPGDTVNIFVWRNPDVSGSFVVRPDGMITTSLVEDIPVSGKTPTEFAREVEKVLSEFINSPIVTVTVGGFVGPYSEQVRIIGEASQPQAINYKQHMTLLDVMIAVGGLTEFADGNDAVLVRMESGQQKQYNILIDDLIKGGKISANVDILPGDIIIIPEAWF